MKIEMHCIFYIRVARWYIFKPKKKFGYILEGLKFLSRKIGNLVPHCSLESSIRLERMAIAQQLRNKLSQMTGFNAFLQHNLIRF
jgi:hypothetical protein